MPLLADSDISAPCAPPPNPSTASQATAIELDLLFRAADGDAAAQNTLIENHLDLIESLARKMATLRMPKEDLVSEGVLGMIRAIELFDPDAGVQLSTYAVPWIKQVISRALSNNSQTIRLPYRVGVETARMRAAAESLAEKLGRDPSNDEVAEVMGVEPERVALLQQVLYPASLDSHGASEEGESMIDEISDPQQMTPSEAAAAAEMYEILDGVLTDGSLEKLEAIVIQQRFGIAGHPVRSLEDIGADLKTSRDTVRRIQAAALNKLRQILLKRGL